MSRLEAIKGAMDKINCYKNKQMKTDSREKFALQRTFNQTSNHNIKILC